METSRRAFLTTACLIPGVGAIARLASANQLGGGGAVPGLPPFRQTFRIGYQLIGWSWYFPSSWWQGAEAVGRLGYRGVEGESTIVELYEGREEEFENRMRRCGVRLCGLYCNSSGNLASPRERDENVRKNLLVAAFCSRMGAKAVMVGGGRPTRALEAFKYYAQVANEIGRRMTEVHGVRLHVHPHTNSFVETREDIGRVMDLTDPRYVHLCPDTAHLVAGGSDPVEVFETYKARIAHVHLKDYVPPRAPGDRGLFVVPGKGTLDFAPFVRIMAGRGFDGWMNIEVDSSPDPNETARRGKEYVVGTLGLSLEDPVWAEQR